jgi:hypothetical protein
MIYLMPIDECATCGARTPRIVTHRCLSQAANGRTSADLAAELQPWIASQVRAGSAGSESLSRPLVGVREAIEREPTLSPAARRHLIGLVDELRRRPTPDRVRHTVAVGGTR